MADNVFATVNSNRQKIADNYLSLKAYAATAADQVQDYLAKGKGRNLSSLGDLLKSIGALKDVKALAAKGVGFGGKSIELPFSGSIVKADDSVFINAHAVGLSSKLSDFETLAVRMTHYEKMLSTMTAKLPATKLAGKGHLVKVAPPQWQ